MKQENTVKRLAAIDERLIELGYDPKIIMAKGNAISTLCTKLYEAETRIQELQSINEQRDSRIKQLEEALGEIKNYNTPDEMPWDLHIAELKSIARNALFIESKGGEK